MVTFVTTFRYIEKLLCSAAKCWKSNDECDVLPPMQILRESVRFILFKENKVKGGPG